MPSGFRAFALFAIVTCALLVGGCGDGAAEQAEAIAAQRASHQGLFDALQQAGLAVSFQQDTPEAGWLGIVVLCDEDTEAYRRAVDIVRQHEVSAQVEVQVMSAERIYFKTADDEREVDL